MREKTKKEKEWYFMPACKPFEDERKGNREGEKVRRWQWRTDLLDCSGQVQAKLNDFVLRDWEISDPCERGPGKQEKSSFKKCEEAGGEPTGTPHCAEYADKLGSQQVILNY